MDCHQDEEENEDGETDDENKNRARFQSANGRDRFWKNKFDF